MDVSTGPDPARLTGIWSQGSVPTDELQKLEAYTGAIVDQVLTVLQQTSRDESATQAAMNNLKALQDIANGAQPQLPAPPPGSRVYTGRQQIGSPSGFQWLMRSYYNVTSYSVQEQPRVDGDMQTLRASIGTLCTEAQAALATPGPLSGETIQTGTQNEQKQVGSHPVTSGGWFNKTTTQVPDYQTVSVPVMSPAQPAIEMLIASIKTAAHDLNIVGGQINSGGVHLQTSQYQDTEDQDLGQHG